jgi:hypothetical protein
VGGLSSRSTLWQSDQGIDLLPIRLASYVLLANIKQSVIATIFQGAVSQAAVGVFIKPEHLWQSDQGMSQLPTHFYIQFLMAIVKWVIATKVIAFLF